MTDVARRAGVSISTVSRVISGSVNVSDDLRVQVMAAIRELNYEPIRVQSTMHKGNVSSIAVMLPGMDTQFFANIVRGIQRTCFEHGYTMLIYNSDDDPEKEIIHTEELMLHSEVQGVIFVGAWTWEHQDHIIELHERGVAVCLINRYVPGVPLDLVEVDQNQGIHEATAHLIRLGHRRIAAITGIPGGGVNPDQLVGFRRALEDFGLKLDQDLIVQTARSPHGGYLAALPLLNQPDRPDAILARSDRLALGVLRAATELSIAVPGDLSIVGYDDEPDSAYWSPPLTTVRQPQFEMGTKAAVLLCERIQNRSLPQRQILIQPQLIVRESTAPHPRIVPAHLTGEQAPNG